MPGDYRVCEAIYLSSKVIDDTRRALEVLLPGVCARLHDGAARSGMIRTWTMRGKAIRRVDRARTNSV